MSDQPSIIRQDAQHSVTVSEGTLVATSKPSDPHAPQIRQNLAGEAPNPDNPQETEKTALPPASAKAESRPGVIFERTVAVAPEDMRQAPAAQAQPASSDPAIAPAPTSDSSQAVEIPAPLAPPTGQSETAVDRFLRERRLAVPADEPGADPSAGPVFERSSNDHFEPVPEDLSRSGDPAEGPALGQTYSDRKVPIAPADARPRGPVQLAPREGSRRAVAAPAAAPVPAEQARQEIAEAAQEVQQRVEETIGAADQEWVEMDFPARVVKLKIENDKVRVRLEQLEEMAEPRRRSDASA